ncbi:MAG: arginase family protein [bacterium]
MNIYFITVILILIPSLAFVQKYRDTNNQIKVVLVQNPYTGDRASQEVQAGPERLASGGLKEMLSEMGVEVKSLPAIKLTPEEEAEYGKWNRFGMANGHLGKMVSDRVKQGYFPIGLLANCNSLMGMLAGLQHSGPGRRPLKVGLIYIDAHGDFNTPETTLSGMLGGMPVAVAAGHCLHRLRLQSGLDPALPERYIVLAGLRDTDPLEQERIDNSLITMLSVEDIRNLSENIHLQMKRLSKLTDLIYIHIDMDVLDPKEVSGHPLTVADGPTSRELAAALELMFHYKKAAALGIASYPYQNDKDNISLKAAYNLIAGAIKGIKER